MSATPQVLLSHHLKQLKLPTVLREYDKVAREGARDGVDHLRHLRPRGGRHEDFGTFVEIG